MIWCGTWLWYMIYGIWYMMWYDMMYDMIYYDILWYDMTWQDTTRHGMARHDTTRQDKTRHNTTRHTQMGKCWSKNAVILTKFSSLTALKVVILTTSSAAIDENFINTWWYFCFNGYDMKREIGYVMWYTIWYEAWFNCGFSCDDVNTPMNSMIKMNDVMICDIILYDMWCDIRCYIMHDTIQYDAMWFYLSHRPLGDLFKNLLIGIFQSFYYNVLWWMPQDLTDDKSTLVQVMAWCRQVTSHYLNQCWPRSPTPYGVTRPQWVKSWKYWRTHS